MYVANIKKNFVENLNFPGISKCFCKLEYETSCIFSKTIVNTDIHVMLEFYSQPQPVIG